MLTTMATLGTLEDPNFVVQVWSAFTILGPEGCTIHSRLISGKRQAHAIQGAVCRASCRPERSARHYEENLTGLIVYGYGLNFHAIDIRGRLYPTYV